MKITRKMILKHIMKCTRVESLLIDKILVQLRQLNKDTHKPTTNVFVYKNLQKQFAQSEEIF